MTMPRFVLAGSAGGCLEKTIALAEDAGTQGKDEETVFVFSPSPCGPGESNHVFGFMFADWKRRLALAEDAGTQGKDEETVFVFSPHPCGPGESNHVFGFMLADWKRRLALAEDAGTQGKDEGMVFVFSLRPGGLSESNHVFVFSRTLGALSEIHIFSIRGCETWTRTILVRA
ncbi:MAG: hypothetical protein RBT51_13865 [Ectothiorhodospiraceae bacterium]|nr:hypothetical protein [Ectothiorhodospiraceae bacterium]